MKKTFLLLLLSLFLILLSSCATSLSIPYTQPSNIDMGAYRNVAIASAVEYKGRQSIPLYIRLDITDPKIQLYTILTSYDYNSINQTAAKELTKMVNKVFNSTSYYSTLSSDKTDAYTSLYKIGKDPSEMLKEDGVDALIIPKISYLHTDEYIDADRKVDSNGKESVRYFIHRYIELSISITVLDTSTNKIVAIREYSTSDYDSEEFDPRLSFLYGYGVTEEELVESALSSLIGNIISDFVPTKRHTNITLMSNKPKLESVEEAYKAAENGNMALALSEFEKAYNEEGHIPSGYNASLILASQGDLDSAISILENIRASYDNKSVNRLYSTLLNLKEKNERASEQMKEKSGEIVSHDNIYSYLFD